METGLIFDIKRFAINDGPGIRMTIFFKGCNLSCEWCHNPESMSPRVQKMYTASKCIGALECIKECPNEALKMTAEGVVTDFDACALCGRCAEVCPSKAFEMSGQILSIEELMSKLENEAIFFDQSGGGVTFSGGEPLMHADYLIEALKECGKRYYHRVVDTTAFAHIDVLMEVAAHTELFLIDLKVMDSEVHRSYTGVGNEKILRNIEALAKTSCEIIFRIPLIDGVNTDEENIETTADFILGLEGDRRNVNLLPYHNIAENKYNKLGNLKGYKAFAAPQEKEVERIMAQFREKGIDASVGG
jgi:pyruvate formate lyase activating enzyme